MSGRIALLVGGGPAPGINGVISAVTIEAINRGFEVIGCHDGYKWLIQGSTGHIRKLTIADVSRLHLNGGSILGTARANPAKNDADMAKVLDTFRTLGVSALVSIGGDDTAFSASQVWKRTGGAIKVAHVPKTIDNDLPLPPSVPTFGFETARHYGVFLVRNLAEDAKTTSRWYIIGSMGRAAGHLALGIGKAAAATLTLIPEEFAGKRLTIRELCDTIAGSIIKRKSQDRAYGVVVMAEGLMESVGEQGLIDLMGGENLSRYGKVERDPHGHLRLGEIDFARMIKDALHDTLKEIGIKVAMIDKEVGYELRSADPIPFDIEYTRDLGYGAVKFLCSPQAEKCGAIITFVDGVLDPLPFEEVVNPATGRMKPRKVDIASETYECARRYMIRLEKPDFFEPQLSRVAAAAGMTPQQFQSRFQYLTEPRIAE